MWEYGRLGTWKFRCGQFVTRYRSTKLKFSVSWLSYLLVYLSRKMAFYAGYSHQTTGFVEHSYTKILEHPTITHSRGETFPFVSLTMNISIN